VEEQQDMSKSSASARKVPLLSQATSPLGDALMGLLDLFKPKWRHSKAEIRLKAMGMIENQALLARIATKDNDADVRGAAVLGLTDQALLARIATEDNDADVRGAAVLGLTDQALLARIATEDNDGGVRGTAAWRVTDQALVARIATEDKHERVRQAAAEGVTDQALLARIATEDEDAYVRKAAALRLTDQALLAKIATEDEHAAVRKAAAQGVTEQALLARIATEAKISNPLALIPIEVCDRFTTDDYGENYRLGAAGLKLPSGTVEVLDLIVEAARCVAQNKVWRWFDCPQYPRIRELGEQIHDEGGIPAMWRACAFVVEHSRNAPPSRALLNHMWNGVGHWIA
jgi:hypothetical protein